MYVCVCICVSFNHSAPLCYNDSPCTLPAMVDNNNSLAPFNSVHIIRAYRIILGQTYVADRICVLIIYRFPTDRHHSRPSTRSPPPRPPRCRPSTTDATAEFRIYRYIILYIFIYIYRIPIYGHSLICTRQGRKHTHHYPICHFNLRKYRYMENIIIHLTDVVAEPEWVGTGDLCTHCANDDIRI